MNVISKRTFNDAAKKYPNNRAALMDMFKVLQKNDFHNPNELKAVFPSLDNFKYKDKWWVLDVGGNHLRVISFIQFVNKRMYIKFIVSHADYDKLTVKYRKEKDRK
jgi:mRNA interferase HigB